MPQLVQQSDGVSIEHFLVLMKRSDNSVQTLGYLDTGNVLNIDKGADLSGIRIGGFNGSGGLFVDSDGKVWVNGSEVNPSA